MNQDIKLLKLTTQEAIMCVIIDRSDNDYIVVDSPSLVFAEGSADGGTKISYVPWVPFYENQKGIRINKNTIVTGLFEEVNKELKERYLQMVNPNKILMPNKKLIV